MSAADNPALYVVTVSDGQEQSGCVVGFATQCSIYPERFLVCLSKLNHTYEVASRAPALAIHLLTEADEDLAHRFGELSGDDANKFVGLEITYGACGAPVLRGARPWIAGPLVLTVDFGDHVGFVIEPTESGGTNAAGALRSESIDLDAAHPPSEILST
jgi:flavin reductase (DIM6/NTAB) family NADH-FMN oxidoreductase RutF